MTTGPRKAASIVPDRWIDLVSGGVLTAGMDLGTTQKGTSNPTALAVIEKVAPRYVCRLALAWKTNNPDVTRAVIDKVLSDLAKAQKRLSRLPIDATNERFFAADLAKELAGKTVVDQIVASENTTHRGEEMKWKLYLGNLLVNAIEGGELVLPNEQWVRNHIRQVYREKGTFEADVDGQGNHADFFDALKLALHGQKVSGGPASAMGMSLSGGGKQPSNKKLPEVFTRMLAAGKRLLNS